MAITIDYYLSLNSPWTYIGSGPFAEIARRYGAEVNVKPAKFGPIFEQTGGGPPPQSFPHPAGAPAQEVKNRGGGGGGGGADGPQQFSPTYAAAAAAPLAH